jgi:cell division septum initiation protein DivIVA
MSVNFKALGGMFTFRYINDNDVEDLDLEDLQDIYNDLEEEYKDLEGEYKELKSELGKLKDIIDKKNPEGLREKKKKKKPKTAKEILGDEDIPYEVRMKYIIDAYRKDQEKWGKLYDYTKHLEKEVMRLKEIQIVNGFTDKVEGIEIETSAQVIKDLRKKIKDLEAKVKDLEKCAGDPLAIIRVLENRIENTYPQRKYKMSSFKKVIKSQEEYIKRLQKLLDENGITYHLKEPINDLEANGADNIDENAVRD